LKSFITALAVVASLTLAGTPPAVAECHWWQFGRCNDQTEGLPDEVPRVGVVITIDASTNRAYLFRDGQLIAHSAAATGSGKEFVHGEDMWIFHTPRGHLKVKGKIKDPVWHKPDWAFLEAGEPVPPQNSPLRDVHGKLGRYALSLGDGILIHGTDDADSIGRHVSHGCIRLPDSMMEKIFDAAKVGTDVYIFDSQQPTEATPSSDLPQRR
jgi:L,D-transpeptidase ErfK/SrfK